MAVFPYMAANPTVPRKLRSKTFKQHCPVFLLPASYLMVYFYYTLCISAAGQLYQYTIPHYLQQFPDRYGTPAIYAGTVRSNILARRHHLDVSRDIVLYLYLLGSHRFFLGRNLLSPNHRTRIPALPSKGDGINKYQP